MRIKRIWKDLLFFLLSAAFILLIVLFLIRIAPKPPVGEMEYARITIAKAESSNAGTYSRKLFNEAKSLYDSAMVNWKRENDKFLYFRDYDKVAKFAQLSADKAEKAMENSRASASSLKIKLKQKIDTLEKTVDHLNRLFSSYPLSTETRNRISKGKLLLEESEIAYKKGQYLQANKKITDSEYLLVASYENAVANLKDYFKAYPVWRKWTDKAISESRQNHSYSIIVDKFSRKCFIYHGGVVRHEYSIELGRNWVGDKKVKGDKATPEGMYRIIKKFDSRQTKYYKALLIDYPNQTDREEFRRDISNGNLPRSAKIGGLIEIHGNGGKGVDWTEGCIAVTDSEMDVIFKLAKEGTPVTIVGSTTTLENVLD